MNRNKLSSALIQYDEKERKKKYYNKNAIALYLQALDRAVDDVAAGHTIRRALCLNFNGRLLDILLKAIGEEKSTLQEQRF